MTLLNILILAVVQGLTELLPVSSSAHVIVAEKLMGLDPTSPQMTFFLVMLHTGTMFAVIVFFWNLWKAEFFQSRTAFWDTIRLIVAATVCTVIAGMALKFFIEKFILKGGTHAEIEMLFGNLIFISAALAAVGVLILIAGWSRQSQANPLGLLSSCWIGAVQGICLPFRGFSRSGATISTGMLLGIERKKLEAFSFALAVVLTPPVIARECLRLLKFQHESALHGPSLFSLFGPGLLGMVLSFGSGLLALKWLSSWLESGRWHFFGVYCLCAATIVFFLYSQGL